MIATLKIDSEMRYQDVGNGPVIVLLHGYLETLKVWKEFSQELSGHFRIIAPDLPGHGKSQITEEIQTMDSMAYQVKLMLDHLKIEKCLMVGHSMGGYVALAFLERYPHMIAGISLFHSGPFADSEEKKQHRNREINLIKNGKKSLVYHNHIAKTFANDNIYMHPQISQKLIKMCEKSSEYGVIAALEGMKSRPDRSEILANTTIPVQYIIGKMDNFIPFQILDRLKLPECSEVIVLENSGHMGMFEEKEKSLNALISFAHKVFGDQIESGF
jgi:pimeloyl-ACP methyl ester carboxylesterase